MRTTYLSELFDDFLSSVDSYVFLELSNEEIEEDLMYLFRKAKGRFYKCRNRLDLLSDEEGKKYFGYLEEVEEIRNTESSEYYVETDESERSITTREVKVELTDLEKNILTHIMLSEYLKPRVMMEEFLRPSMSDKGFRIHSQANHLRELNLLYRLVKRECNKMITEYTYLDLEGE